MANQSTAASSLMLLLQLIEAKDWQKLNSIFLLNPEKFRAMSSMINSKSSSFNGMTLLHATCRFNPPSKIVRRMIELCPDDVKAVDCLNRTPLHVAAGTGASFNVVDALLDAYPQACDTQDDDGRTPLHLACDRSCILFEGSVNSNDAPNYDIVSNLISASPSSVTLEDDDEMTALEYALMSSGELNVVRMLQKASQKILRQKQEESKTKQQLVGFSPKGKVFTARSA